MLCALFMSKPCMQQNEVSRLEESQQEKDGTIEEKETEIEQLRARLIRYQRQIQVSMI